MHQRPLTPAPPALLLILVVIMTLLAAGTRFDRIGAQSLWNDEGNSYVQATRPLDAIAYHAGLDIHPPGYYWALAVWRSLTGETEVALRLLSAWSGVIAVAAITAIAWRAYGWIGALAAGAVAALNSFAIYYGQEARMYAPLLMWSALSTWALIALLEHRRARLLLALFTAAGLYTHYAYPFVMIAQGLTALIALRSDRRWRRTLTALLVAYGVGIALFSPWLPTVWGQLTTWGQTTSPLDIQRAAVDIPHALLMGITTNAIPLSLAFVLLVFALIPLRGVALWRRLLPPLLTVVPPAIALGAGIYQPDDLKILLPATVGAALWLAQGAWVLWRADFLPRLRDNTRVRWLLRAASLLTIIWVLDGQWTTLPDLHTDPAFSRPDYRGVSAALSAQARPNDAIILSAPNQREVFAYYYRGETPVHPLPVGLGGDDAATAEAVNALIAAHDRVIVLFWGETERDPRRIVETTLSQRAYEISDTWISDLRLAQFASGAVGSATQYAIGFGDAIVLDSAALSADTLDAGDMLRIRLTWRALRPITERYKVFVQLLDADGRLALGRDSEPVGGLGLTTTWEPDDPVIDQHALLLDELPAGAYRLIIGLYAQDPPYARLTTSQRSDFLVLGEIRVR